MAKLPKYQTEQSAAAPTPQTQAPKPAGAEMTAALVETKHLISSLPMILIGLSKEREVVYWNSRAEEVFDLAASNVTGLPLSQCGIDWDWERIAAGISQSLTQRCPVRLDDVEFRRPDGEERYLSVTINPTNGDQDSILGLTITGADMTGRKKLETQLQQSHKMEALGQLAAGIAHEINTPTQFVGDNTRFFQDSFADLIQIADICKELVDAAKSNTLSAERILAVERRIAEIDVEYLAEEIPVAIQHTLKGVERITKIVQAMKIFAHPGMMEKEPTDINQEIEKTITITRNEWKYVADLITDFDPSLPLVPCFRAELNQVILNMIVNAAHAVAEVNRDKPDRKGTIRISTRHQGNRAEIQIQDTGAGIPKEIRHKVFDLFFTTKEPGKGTGQGLAIAHSVIVEKHKGTITLESQVQKGTTFILSLPLDADSEQNE
jgi:PAS domain S-box-containing protein